MVCINHFHRKRHCPWDLITLDGSYQVPKEVGKIGTESPTFIQPIQKKDWTSSARFDRFENELSQAEREITFKREVLLSQCLIVLRRV